jgi:hypothetical protein
MRLFVQSTTRVLCVKLALFALTFAVVLHSGTGLAATSKDRWNSPNRRSQKSVPGSGSTVNTVYFSDDFENGLSKWTESTGYWGTVTCDYRSTTNSASATPLSGTSCPPEDYPVNVNASLTLADAYELNLSGGTSPILTFWHKYSIGSGCCYWYDYGYVEYSTNYGVTWTKMSNADTQSPNSNGPGFVGNVASWYPEEFDLTQIPDWNTKLILIRFRLWSSGNSPTGWGWMVDDVEVREKGTTLNVGLTASVSPSGGGSVTGAGIDCPGTCSELWTANWDLSGREWASEDTTYENSPAAMSAVPDYPNGGDYAVYANSVLEQATPVSIAGATAPTLSIWTEYSIASGCCYWYDYGYVEYSTNYGLSWTPLSNQDTVNPNGNGPGFDGTVTSWTQEQFDLTQITNWQTLPIQVRFRLWSSGNSPTGWGWLIDDPEIYDPATGKVYFGPDYFGSGSLPDFADVTLTATPSSGYTFESWTGCNSTSGSQCTINRYIDRIVAATFSPSSPTYTLSASPSSLSVAQGTQGTSTITVTPVDGFTGSVALSASGLPSGVTASFNPSSVTITGTSGVTSTLTLAASATATTGTATVTLTGTSGSLTADTQLSLTVTSGPAVSLSTGALKFGDQAVDTTSTAKAVTLTNTGTATLDISSIAITAGNTFFEISSNACGATLEVGKKCTVKVEFSPGAQLAAETGTLTFTDNASNSPQTVTLTGTGVAQATLTPSPYTFVKTKVGDTATHTFTLKNNLETTLTGVSYSVSSSSPGVFSIESSTCGTTLDSKKTCTIDVTFTPSSEEKFTGTLSVSDSANDSPQTSSLTGTGD